MHACIHMHSCNVNTTAQATMILYTKNNWSNCMQFILLLLLVKIQKNCLKEFLIQKEMSQAYNHTEFVTTIFTRIPHLKFYVVNSCPYFKLHAWMIKLARLGSSYNHINRHISKILTLYNHLFMMHVKVLIILS